MADPQGKPVPAPTRETLPFWEGCRRGELMIQRCGECGHFQFFPRLYCARCMSERVDWLKASGRAEVTSFTIVRRPVSAAFAADVPYVVALVRLEEGPTMMTNIVGCPPERVAIGMAVEAIFERLTDEIMLPKFRPRNG
ncbi:Zn-ribbon domain-containing OB-fold protein [bacterium]|nr:Zn-ribbon domain-containing OB-fold protein [bacterium]